MTNVEAAQVAALLNRRNQLTVQYTAETVLESADNYVVSKNQLGDVVACVEVKKVQWYQAEVLHLTVDEGHEGKGFARRVFAEALARAQAHGARVLQCTIRDGNTDSIAFFTAAGFSLVSTFYNERSKNNVGVWQRVLVPAFHSEPG